MAALSALVFALFDNNPEPELSRYSSLVNPVDGCASVVALYKGEAFKIEIERMIEE